MTTPIVSMAQSCCNPFDIPGHTWSSRKKNLRPVSAWMCERAPNITIDMKICDTCRKKLSKESPWLDVTESAASELNPSSSQATQSDSLFFHSSEAVSSLNVCLAEIGETPFSQCKSRSKVYCGQKVKKITEALQRTVIPMAPMDDGTEMIQQLKEKLWETNRRSEQVQVLTVLPKSWTVKKIQQEFGVSEYLAQQSKKLVEERGILSLPGPSRRPSLSPETFTTVCNFYESDEISRVMPGKKDFVSVKKEGKREHFQKRLVLSDLKQVYREFKEKFPNYKIGFSKFAELRPKHCVLAGASGTHSVCVCTIHQNVKLMSLVQEMQIPELPTYHHCLGKTMCNPPHPRCYLGECDACPKIEILKEDLLNHFDEIDVEQIVYKQWVSTDRSTLETFCSPIEEFADTFCKKIELLRPHSFIASEQASFYANCKTTLKMGEFLVTVDFSENYSFILQDAAQGFHWNNSSATLHPFVAYYLDSEELRHLSYVVISDCLHHDTVAVHLFQRSFITFLKQFLPARLHPCKIIYFSDGAAPQYKNRKNFLNLCHHKDDFGVEAEWHFSATSHGKGACDGLGRTVKRLAARASLQRPYNDQLMTARQLFDWACSNISAAHFGYCSNEDYRKELSSLEGRFQLSRTIPGTRKLHCFVPVSDSTVEVKFYSSSHTSRKERVALGKNEIPPESIAGFVTCLHEGNWWFACVLKVCCDTNKVQLTFLHPHGPSNSFKYPEPQNIHTIPMDHILTLVDPRTRSGRVYSLTKKEMTLATKLLHTISSQL